MLNYFVFKYVHGCITAGSRRRKTLITGHRQLKKKYNFVFIKTQNVVRKEVSVLIESSSWKLLSHNIHEEPLQIQYTMTILWFGIVKIFLLDVEIFHILV